MGQNSKFFPTRPSTAMMSSAKFHHGLHDPNVTRSATGMLCVFLFTLCYLIRPIHLVLPLLILYFGSLPWKILAAPAVFAIVVSFLLPPQTSPFWVRTLMGPMLEYFAYEEIEESTPIDVQESMTVEGRQYIFACQPHSIVPYCGIAWSVRRHQHDRGRRHRRSSIIPTAVASMVLYTPVLKHAIGMLGCITIKQMKERMATRYNDEKKEAAAGVSSTSSSLPSSSSSSSVRLYVGSAVDIFFCTPDVEVLELTKRKKFIFLALQSGVDVVPVYMFGNTATFSVVTGHRWISPWLVRLSRFFNAPVTYVAGRYGLPFLPKRQQLLSVSGQPLGMPHLKHPRPSQVDFWHKRYCEQVQRLFDEYKERVPSYKNKTLVIV